MKGAGGRDPVTKETIDGSSLCRLQVRGCGRWMVMKMGLELPNWAERRPTAAEIREVFNQEILFEYLQAKMTSQFYIYIYLTLLILKKLLNRPRIL